MTGSRRRARAYRAPAGRRLREAVTVCIHRVFIFLIGVRDEVNHDRRGQDQHGVLPLVDVDCVSVRQTDPLLARARHLVAVALEHIFVVEEVAPGLEVVGARDIDAEPGAKQREQVLPDDRDGRPCRG